MRQTYVKREGFESNVYIINLKNDFYFNIILEKLKTEPNTPDYYSLIQKPFPYNPKSRPKYFMKFLKELLWTDDIPTAIDIIAYTFLKYLVFIINNLFK